MIKYTNIPLDGGWAEIARIIAENFSKTGIDLENLKNQTSIRIPLFPTTTEATEKMFYLRAGSVAFIGAKLPAPIYRFDGTKWVDTGVIGGGGQDGVTFTPQVDMQGNLSWTNNGGLSNPSPVKLKGQKGDPGKPFTYNDFTPSQIEALQKPATDAAKEALNVPKIQNGTFWTYDVTRKVYVDSGNPATGKSPKIQGGTWWTWDDNTKKYVNTGVSVNSTYELTKQKVEYVLTGDVTTHNHTTQLEDFKRSLKIDAGKVTEDGTHRFVTDAEKNRWNCKVISHGTGDTTYAISPNTLNVWGEVASLNLTLGAEEPGIYNAFSIEFKSGQTPTKLTLPSSVRWNKPLAIKANKTYQVSIVNNLAVWGEF